MIAKQINAKALLGVGAALIIVGTGAALMTPKLEPDRAIGARIGDVKWNHEQHARMEDIPNCQVCHHTERPGTTNPRPCSDCHRIEHDHDLLIAGDLFMDIPAKKYEGDFGPPPMVAMHAKCIGCHKAMEEGPVSCRDCHDQTFSGNLGLVTWDHRHHARKMDTDCVRCHHKDTEAVTDAEYRACGDCHIPAAIKGLALATGIEEHENAKHGKCHTCHTIANPEIDNRSCVDCHPGLAVAEKTAEGEENPPSLEQALHGRCMECHSMEYPDLEPSMPVLCTDCHKPDSSIITLEGANPILWSHKRHAEYTRWECNRCHHTDIPDEPHMACRSCHGKGQFAGIPDLDEALSRNCIDCHKEEGAGLTCWESLEGGKSDLSLLVHPMDRDGSRYFWWDHRFHAVGAAISCRACHHNTMVLEGMPETAGLARPGIAESATHFQACTSCHGEDGPVPGSPADGAEAPPFQDALQAICLNCHQELDCGPLTWDELYEKRGLTPEERRKMMQNAENAKKRGDKKEEDRK